MRTFLIQSEHYTNDAVVGFSPEGFLVLVDVSATGMAENYAKWMFRGFPLKIEEFMAFCKEKGVVCVESSLQIDFEKWWEEYGNKVNKKRCIPVWNKLPKTKQVEVYYNTKDYNAFLDFENWRAKSDPETYLKKPMYDTDWKGLLKQAKLKRNAGK